MHHFTAASENPIMSFILPQALQHHADTFGHLQADLRQALTAGESMEAVPDELKADVTSYCCIDYPSLSNVVLLRLHKLRRSLQDQASDR